MTNLVVFNIYWYLIVSVIVTLWALTDILRGKEQKLFYKIWDWAVLVLGTMAWYASIYTFQSYMLGTLTQDRLEDLDSWVNVWLTLCYLGVSSFVYITYTRPNKRLVRFVLERMEENKKCV